MRLSAALLILPMMMGALPAASQETTIAAVVASPPDRAETVQQVSAAMARIQAEFNQDAIYASSDAGLIEAAVQVAIEQMLSLRDNLVNNPHIRLSGFSVGFPAGISADFEFP